MTEDIRTLWVGNLDDKVTEELVYELFLQAGPIDRLIFPTEGEGDNKKHKGHAYVVFLHKVSVHFATQVMEGTTLFTQPLSMKPRSLPNTYKTESSATNISSHISPASNRGRFDNSSLRGGFNRNLSGRNDFSPRGRGGYRGRGGSSYNSYNSSSYSSQGTSNNWQQGASNSSNIDDKRQRILQQQNLTLDTHRQMQQQQPSNVMNSQGNQRYGQQQQQQQWYNNSYNTGTGYQQQYNSNQYNSNWYQQK